MKKTLCLLIVSLALFGSCKWNLSSSGGDISDVKVTTVTETAETVEKASVFHDGALNSYEIRYIDNASARTIGQIQKYDAKGNLLGIWKYARSGGFVNLAAYYSASASLAFFYVYTCDTNGFVTGTYYYDASQSLQWSRLFAPRASGTAKGKLETAASFNSAGSIDGGLKYYFIDTASLASATWNVEVSYGSNAPNLVGGASASNPAAGSVNVQSLQAEAQQSVSLPSTPALPSLSLPSDFSASGLAKSGYRFSIDDSYGNSTVAVGSDWFPVSGTRTDSRLGAAVTAKLTRDSSGRITDESTYYGSTLALQVDIAYDGSTWFPVSVSTTGKAMLVPLSYKIAYRSSSHAVDTVAVYSGDTCLRVLKYSYPTEPSAQSSPSGKNMDPFGFLGSLLSSGVTILDYKGDGTTLVETFTSAPVRDSNNVLTGVTVTVNLPKADGSAGGDYNGSYLVGYDSSGTCDSLQAKDRNGNVLWSQNISSLTGAWASMKSAASGLIDDGVNYGTLVESFIPAGATSSSPAASQDVISGIATNFVYNLIF